MSYYKLTDAIRGGEVIRAEGGKQYRYSHGASKWVRTAVMLNYMNENSPLYGQYETIDEAEALELLMARENALQSLLTEARSLAGRLGREIGADGEPATERLRRQTAQTPDLEEKIVLLLAACPASARENVKATPRIRRALQRLDRADGEDDESYLRRVRMDALARAVKEIELRDALNRAESRGDRDGAQAAHKALESLTNGGSADAGAAQARFVPASELYSRVKRAALEGRKLPHGLSNPVLRREKGRLFLAFFVNLYTKADLDSAMLPRPSYWLLADPVSGEILERHACGEKDFCNLAADARLSAAWAERPEGTADRLKQAYDKLDRVRKGLAQGREPDRELYDAYLEEMLGVVPPAWRSCYRELSRI